jgi:phosphatidylglycerol lysyltransferase
MSAIDAKPPLRTSLQRAAPLLGLVLFALAIAVVHRELDEYHYADIMAAVAQVPWRMLLFGLLVTAINYAALTAYDFLALRHLGKPLPAARVLVASLVGFAVSNNTGHALIAGTSLRYRFYGAFGLTAPDLIQLAIFLSITYLLGVATLAVGAWAWSPGFAATIPGGDSIIHGAQYAALAALLVYWGMVILRRQPMQLRGYQFALPSPLTTLMQTLVGAADLTLASLTLYIFLRLYVDLPFGHFLVFYLFAQLAGLYSQVPGGIGVFESVFILLARGAVPADAMVAALALYRVVYFFIPLAVAGAGLLAFEIWQQRSAMRQRGELITSLLTSLLGRSVPQIFALLLMLAGSVLLFSGATPTATGVAEVLRDVMPLPLMETSHLLGSLVGLLLLFFARAVWLRLEVAYPAAVVLLLFGILFSLLKGFDWQEALILSAMLILLLPTRRYFIWIWV